MPFVVRMIVIMRMAMFVVMVVSVIVAMFVVVVVVMRVPMMIVVVVHLPFHMQVRDISVMRLTRTMRMVVCIMEMSFCYMLVQVTMFMRVRMEMNVHMAIRTVNMAVRVEEVAYDMAVVFIHILFVQDTVEKLMGHKRQRQFKFVSLQKPPVIQY